MKRFAIRLALVVAIAGAVGVVAQVPPFTPARPAPPADAKPQRAAQEPPQPTALVQVLQEPHTWRGLIEQFLGRVVDFLPNLLAAFLVLAAFALLHRLAKRAFANALRDSKADPALHSLGLRLTRYVFFGFALLMAANQLGFQVGSVLAGLGIVGVALGFAAQDLLANLIAGFTILWDRPFRIGDVVVIAGTRGTVTDIGLRSTRLRTQDVRDVILPNREVINETIINLTSTPELRVDLPIGIGYREDLRRVREVLLEAVEGTAGVAAEPAPHVVVAALGESAVEVELRFFVRDARDEPALRAELLEKARSALDAVGIEFPFPQRVVQIASPVEISGSR